jgi:hypothetical protein
MGQKDRDQRSEVRGQTEFLTAENAESAEKRFTTEGHEFTRRRF